MAIQLPVPHGLPRYARNDDSSQGKPLSPEAQALLDAGRELWKAYFSYTDTRTVRDLVKKITTRYTLPYFTLTPTFSVCAEHGYMAGEKTVCPDCQRDTEVYSRVVGYLRPVNRWNDAKQNEYAMRTEYVLS